MSRARRQHGFTLFELVLATAMASTLAFALYASLHIAMKARRAAYESTLVLREAMIAADILSRDLGSIPPPTGDVIGPLWGVRGGGLGNQRRDTVSFYTFEDDGEFDGLIWIEYVVRSDVSPPALIRRTRRNLLAPVETDPAEEVICRGVTSLALNYFDGYSWYESWEPTEEGNTLPQAIELSVRVVSAESDHAREMTVTRLVPVACAAVSDETVSEDDVEPEVAP